MPELVTDMFNTALQRDVFNKTRDDMGESFARILRNFSQGPAVSSSVVYPAIIALAWTLRAALLSVKQQAGPKVYGALTLRAVELIMPDVNPEETGNG
jgi:hypothetical protein